MNGNDARNERGTGSRASADSDLSARLKSLEAKLDQKRPPASAREESSERLSSEPSAMGRAFRMSAEFVAGVVAGGILGWLCDYGLGTRPWGLIVFLMLGFGAGIYNVMRASGFAGPPSGKGGGAES